MNREQQQRRIRTFRRGIVGGSVVGALGVAGLLGIQHTATATGTDAGTDTGTTTDDSSSSSWGDSPGTSLSSGSSSASHATTMGS